MINRRLPVIIILLVSKSLTKPVAVIGLALTPGWLTTLAALALIIGLFIRRRSLLRDEPESVASTHHALQAKEIQR